MINFNGENDAPVFLNNGAVTVFGTTFNVATEEPVLSDDANGGTSSFTSYVLNGKELAGAMKSEADAAPVVNGNKMELGFTATMNGSAYREIVAKDDDGNVGFGILVIPTADLATLDTFNHGLLADGTYFDVVASEGDVTVANTVTICVNFGEIASGDTEYAVLFYVKYQVQGVDVYSYSGFDAEQNAISAAEVATAALADVSNVPNAVYCYEVEDGVFSPYTNAEREVFAAVVAA